jgi:hypothetical protein
MEYCKNLDSKITLIQTVTWQLRKTIMRYRAIILNFSSNTFCGVIALSFLLAEKCNVDSQRLSGYKHSCFKWGKKLIEINDNTI